MSIWAQSRPPRSMGRSFTEDCGGREDRSLSHSEAALRRIVPLGGGIWLLSVRLNTRWQNEPKSCSPDLEGVAFIAFADDIRRRLIDGICAWRGEVQPDKTPSITSEDDQESGGDRGGVALYCRKTAKTGSQRETPADSARTASTFPASSCWLKVRHRRGRRSRPSSPQWPIRFP